MRKFKKRLLDDYKNDILSNDIFCDNLIRYVVCMSPFRMRVLTPNGKYLFFINLWDCEDPEILDIMSDNELVDFAIKRKVHLYIKPEFKIINNQVIYI